MKKVSKLPSLLISASIVALALPEYAQAQVGEQAEADADVLPGEIIVTANKREERIQDVALSISAVSGDELNEKRLTDLQDIASRVPGLSLNRGSSSGIGQRLIIRGLNTGGSNGTVASAVDEVPLTISPASGIGGDFAADFDPYDMQRIEVLKGPQGTLYGASALGGLVKYVTKLPTTGRLEAGFDVGAFDITHGDQGAFAKGFVNIPLGETLAVRGSGYYEYSPGWISNNLGNDTEINRVRRYGGRFSLLFKPSEDFSIRGTAFFQKRASTGYDVVEVRGYADPANPFALLNGYNKDTYLPELADSKAKIFAVHADYDLGGAIIQSISSYGKIDTGYQFDSPLYVPLSGLFFGRPNTAIVSNSVSSLKKYNQELRLASDNAAAENGRGLEWQVGAFYTRERTIFTNDYITRDATTGAVVTTPASVAATPPGTPQVFLATINTRYSEIAGYADATYHFSPQFDIEVGGRLFRNKQRFTQTTGGALFFPSAFTTVGPFSSTETRATFAIAPRFHFTPDIMLYARAASGYRPGGPNPFIPAAGPPPDTPGTTPDSFDADTTVNYEAGLKATLFDRRLTVDLSAFYIDWKDIQVTATIRRGFTGYSATLNAGKAVSKGVEWNVNFSPMRGLNFGWLGAYTDAKLKVDVPQINAFDGDRLPYSPKWATTLTADLDIPLSEEIDLAVGGSYSYTGARFTNWAFDPTQTHQRVPAYGTWAAQAGFNTGPFTFQLYGKNLTDKRGITQYSRGQLLLVFGPPGIPLPGTASLIRPREIGIRLSGKF